ncbi:sigma factor [Brevibacillus porteri]|uniref:sigma factor n=1 Tax=Brevibacillus porteri TaxID=2126350 RepID=UPI003D1BDFB1
MKGCERLGKVGLEDVYRLHVNDIYRYLFRLTRDERLAEDLTQETFCRAYSSLDDYRGEKVRSWLFKTECESTEPSSPDLPKNC